MICSSMRGMSLIEWRRSVIEPRFMPFYGHAQLSFGATPLCHLKTSTAAANGLLSGHYYHKYCSESQLQKSTFRALASLVGTAPNLSN